MAIYHYSAKIIGRSSGRSAVASVAYRAGVKLENERDGVTHDYSRKNGVVYCEIMLPENAPKSYENRSVLWNAVEQAEKRKDAQTAREVEIALPIEFDLREQILILRDYIKENFVDEGMCADLSIHDKGDGNPHAHIMLTTREVTKDGFLKKNREWNKAEYLHKWRENWAETCNREFARKGLDVRIDHRTLEEQGISREPTIHVGRSPEREAENREIIKRNEAFVPTSLSELNDDYRLVDKYLMELSKKRREADILDRRADEIIKRKAEIDAKQTKIEEAKAELKALKLWQTQNKQRINEKISNFTRSTEQAREYFKQMYKIEVEGANAEIERIKAQSAALRGENAAGEIAEFSKIKSELGAKIWELTPIQPEFAPKYEEKVRAKQRVYERSR